MTMRRVGGGGGRGGEGPDDRDFCYNRTNRLVPCVRRTRARRDGTRRVSCSGLAALATVDGRSRSCARPAAAPKINRLCRFFFRRGFFFFPSLPPRPPRDGNSLFPPTLQHARTHARYNKNGVRLTPSTVRRNNVYAIL